MQIREGLFHVLSEYVRRAALNMTQAIQVVEDILFHTSNKLYDLKLDFRPLGEKDVGRSRDLEASSEAIVLQNFIRHNPSIEYLRLQWMDYTSMPRLRLLPIKRALEMASEQKYVGIVKAVFGLLQEDIVSPGFYAVGEYRLNPRYDSLKLTSRTNHASVQCVFQEKRGDEIALCPRTLLEKQLQKAEENGLSFLVGFEVEIVFMQSSNTPSGFSFGETAVNTGGHAWSLLRALQDDQIMDLLERIFKRFEEVGIEMEQFHPESSPGQYEFVLAKLPPLQAIDTLLAAREIITSICANSSIRATLHPKPYPMRCGTGAHVHLSVEPAEHWEAFYGGILEHLPAITALTYPKAESYERLADGVWAGGTWVTW